jgi:hypothetical protein
MTKIISIVGGMQPSAPTIGTATAGDTTASVAFTASSYIGKGTITYTATSSPGGFTGTSATSPITVTGLTNGTAYTFTVVGNTNYGVASVASAASNSITPAASTSFESIASSRITTNTASITFSSIPQTFKHLQLRWAGATVGGNYLYFDSNLGRTGTQGRISEYGNAWYTSQGFAQDANYGVELHFGGIDATYPAAGVIEIMDYSSTTKSKIGMSRLVRTYSDPQYTVNNMVSFTCGTTTTSAINSVTFQGTASYPLCSGTTVSLYGIKG